VPAIALNEKVYKTKKQEQFDVPVDIIIVFYLQDFDVIFEFVILHDTFIIYKLPLFSSPFLFLQLFAQSKFPHL
jgi:hypothetical protein